MGADILLRVKSKLEFVKEKRGQKLEKLRRFEPNIMRRK